MKIKGYIKLLVLILFSTSGSDDEDSIVVPYQTVNETSTRESQQEKGSDDEDSLVIPSKTSNETSTRETQFGMFTIFAVLQCLSNGHYIHITSIQATSRTDPSMTISSLSSQKCFAKKEIKNNQNKTVIIVMQYKHKQ